MAKIDHLSYFSPSRKATKIRRQLEEESVFDCNLGLMIDMQTGVVNTSRERNLSIFESGDKLLSVNGTELEYPLKIEAPLYNGFLQSLLNTPISRGQDIEYVVERDQKQITLASSCTEKRAELVRDFEIYVKALEKYKPEECIARFDNRDIFMSFALTACRNIELSKSRKISRLRDYSGHMYRIHIGDLNYRATVYRSEFFTKADLLKEDIESQKDAWAPILDWYTANNFDVKGLRLERKLESVLDFGEARLKDIENPLPVNATSKLPVVKVEKIEEPSKERSPQRTSKSPSQKSNLGSGSLLDQCTAIADRDEKLMCSELASKLLSSMEESDSKNEKSSDMEARLARELRVIRTRDSNGTSYQDFPDLLARLQEGLESIRFDLSDTPQSKDFLNMMSEANDIFELYRDAQKWWQLSFEEGKIMGDYDFVCAQSTIASFMRIYPEFPTTTVRYGRECVRTQSGLTFIWALAAIKSDSLEKKLRDGS